MRYAQDTSKIQVRYKIDFQITNLRSICKMHIDRRFF